MDNPNVPRLCKRCNQLRDRVLKKTFADGSKYYTDLEGKKWLGTTGPCCTKKARADYYSPVEHAKTKCEVCSNEYTQRVKTQLYCSQECATKAVVRIAKKASVNKLIED